MNLAEMNMRKLVNFDTPDDLVASGNMSELRKRINKDNQARGEAVLADVAQRQGQHDSAMNNIKAGITVSGAIGRAKLAIEKSGPPPVDGTENDLNLWKMTVDLWFRLFS